MASQSRKFDEKYQALTEALGKVLDDYSLVKYFPLDITDEENIADLFLMIGKLYKSFVRKRTLVKYQSQNEVVKDSQFKKIR